MTSPFDAAVLKRPPRKSAVNTVIDTVERLIMTKQLRPGDRLPSELELTKSLATSRGSIREAMKVLASFGVIDIRRGDGTYVSESMSQHLFDHLLFRMILSDVDKERLHELRELIEVGLVKLVVANAGEEELDAIAAAHQRMADEIARKTQDPARFAELDVAFHRAMAKATKNVLIERIYGFTLELFTPSIEATHEHRRRGVNALRHHQKILDGLLARDAERAEAAVRTSIEQWQILS